MSKDNFNTTIYSEKAIELMHEHSTDKPYSNKAYRIIDHLCDEPITGLDFTPTFIKKGKITFECQDEIVDSGSFGLFGVSFFDSLEKLKSYRPLMKKYQNKSYSIVEGKIDYKKGETTEIEASGHFNLFIYDPTKDNKFDNDFVIIEENKQNE